MFKLWQINTRDAYRASDTLGKNYHNLFKELKTMQQLWINFAGIGILGNFNPL